MSEAESALLPPLVIKKRLKANHPPHGGAWKVAYADFVTAMMAFFLLLWLLNVTIEENKQGISDFFEPETSEEEDQIGTGEALKGLAMVAEGALRSAGSPPSVTVAIATVGSTRGGDEREVIKDDAEHQAEARMKRIEEELERFAVAESELKQAIQDEMNEMQSSLAIDQTSEGMRIQIMEEEDFSIFHTDKAKLNDNGERMFAMVANIITKLPNQVSVAGHTNSRKFKSGAAYTNWELSGDRANAARFALVEYGLAAEKIAKVVGMADRDHLYPKEPQSARNRRISVTLLRADEKEDESSDLAEPTATTEEEEEAAADTPKR